MVRFRVGTRDCSLPQSVQITSSTYPVPGKNEWSCVSTPIRGVHSDNVWVQNFRKWNNERYTLSTFPRILKEIDHMITDAVLSFSVNFGKCNAHWYITGIVD
jgi:hypothetical protein